MCGVYSTYLFHSRRELYSLTDACVELWKVELVGGLQPIP